MEAIKFSVELNVNVNLTSETKNFINSLFASASHCCTSHVSAPSDVIPVNIPPAIDAVPEEVEPKVELTESERTKVKALASQIGIEEVRSLLAAKVNSHRADIKAKLNELGAPSVTKLDPSRYEEMYNFLQGL